MIGILLGLLVWLLLPMVINQHVRRKKKKKKAITERACLIVGVFIIVVSLIKMLF